MPLSVHGLVLPMAFFGRPNLVILSIAHRRRGTALQTCQGKLAVCRTTSLLGDSCQRVLCHHISRRLQEWFSHMGLSGNGVITPQKSNSDAESELGINSIFRIVIFSWQHNEASSHRLVDFQWLLKLAKPSPCPISRRICRISHAS